ncbi:MAG: hypothetical protein KDB27_01745 [Planctomycetales bacterium]|nr:hypothetical protein [Planctomycetales bacterium]
MTHAETAKVQPHPLSRLDPQRFHGAWIFLCESVAAGALVGAQFGVEPALLVGTAGAGAFLVIAALSAGFHGRLRQLVTGGMLLVVSSCLALLMAADSRFISIGAIALTLAMITVVFARRRGFLSTPVLALGVAAITMIAPMTAVAGGASLSLAVILFVILWLFFFWRTTRVVTLIADRSAWNAELLRARGLREAAITASFTLIAAVALKIAG